MMPLVGHMLAVLSGGERTPTSDLRAMSGSLVAHQWEGWGAAPQFILNLFVVDVRLSDLGPWMLAVAVCCCGTLLWLCRGRRAPQVAAADTPLSSPARPAALESPVREIQGFPVPLLPSDRGSH